jgi:hypothetical protein
VPYLLLGLQDVQWAVGNSRGAGKLARTPHVNQKKKKMLFVFKIQVINCNIQKPSCKVKKKNQTIGFLE